LNKYKNPVYYQFESEKDTNELFYWRITGDSESQTLMTDSYDPSKTQVEHFEERFTEKGSNLVEFIFFEEGDRIKTTIISETVFSWSKENQYGYKVESNHEKLNISFAKFRKFIGFENINYMGGTHEAAKFLSNYTYHDLSNNQINKYWQYDFYTMDHGFVKYERHYSNGEQITFVLTGILTEDEWKR